MSSTTTRDLSPLLQDIRVQEISRILSDPELCVVGGSTRDFLINEHISEIDFATRLTPDEVLSRLEAAGLKALPTGLHHQTVTTVVAGENTEITTFRSSGMSPRGGLSRGASIEEDLRYRDFTVNAIAVEVASKKVFSVGEALEDLRAGVIRAVGEAEARFTEDPLRILRMIRLACQLQFRIDAATFAAGQRLVESLQQVSIERVREELSKILLSPEPDRGFRELAALGVLGIFTPEIQRFVAFEQNRFHKADLFEHTLEVVRRSRSDLILRLSALLHDVGKPDTLSVDENGDRHFYRHEMVGVPITRRILERLKYPNKVIDAVCTLVATHMRPLNAGAAGLRRILRDTGEDYERWRELKEADALSCKLESEKVSRELAEFDVIMEEIRRAPTLSPLSSLAIDGNDLKKLGIHEGPKIGAILRELHEQVLDQPELNTREELLQRAKALNQR